MPGVPIQTFLRLIVHCLFFFFQAEDGIRDIGVTGVQTCALPIFATAFDCPFEGRVPEEQTIALLDSLIPMRPDVEVCLCDTTGRADPAHVESLFAACLERFSQAGAWAFHAHDTYGLGLANVHAAFRQGVRVFDASFGGLGGCPFAPGATGNVATEDVVWMFERMGVPTGIDLDSLIAVAREGASLPGGMPGGRVRDALTARPEACPAAATP